MAQLDPDWFATQTVAPADPQIAASTANSLTLAWTPVAYQADDGYYEVGYAPEITGPWTAAGQTVDKAADGFVIDGLEPGRTYYVRAYGSPCPTPGRRPRWTDATVAGAAATASDDTVLLIVYFAADNDLSVYVDPLLERLRRGTLANPNAVVMALVDRAGDDNTEVWRIAEGAAELDTVFLAQLGQTELDTAQPANLSAFLSYARAATPATRTLVSLLGHGVGLAPELAWIPSVTPEEPNPEPQPGIPPLPRGKFATPTDVTSGTFMGTPALGKALLAATDAGADPFDLLFFDQCFAGNLDILYEVRRAADVFIASPNYAWFSAPYQRYLAEFAPTRSAQEMANAVINVYQRSLNDAHPNAIFWLTRADIEAVAAALDDLALALVDAVDAGARAPIYAAAQAAQYVDTTQCGRGNLTLGPPDELLGAGSFARALRDQVDAAAFPAVDAATETLLAALGNVTGNARVGNPYLEPESTWDYTDTLTILAPLLPNAPADRAWRASLYRADLAGQEAVWTPEPGQTVVISETFAYVVDGQWDTFIDAWYAGELTPTVGEWCSYTPPALVTRDGDPALHRHRRARFDVGVGRRWTYGRGLLRLRQATGRRELTLRQLPGRGDDRAGPSAIWTAAHITSSSPRRTRPAPTSPRPRRWMCGCGKR
ncbi:MAG: clostripain-related cysteine peptidase [Caldilineaceae bacterium]